MAVTNDSAPSSTQPGAQAAEVEAARLFLRQRRQRLLAPEEPEAAPKLKVSANDDKATVGGVTHDELSARGMGAGEL